MQLPQWLTPLNQRAANPVRLFAAWAPGFGLLEHIGRRSGRTFRTPVTVYRTNCDGRGGVAILLAFGSKPNWLQNITAAGGGRMRHYGKWIAFTGPRVMPRAQAAQHVKGLGRPIFARLPFDDAMMLTWCG